MDSSQTIGAWPPPPGVTPNFDNPESIAIRIILAAVLCPTMTAVFLGLRLYTAHNILKAWRADDFLIIIAFLFAMAYSIINLVQTKHGAGVHIWDVPLQSYQIFNRIGIAGAITYNLSTLFIKASILTLYLQFSINRKLRVTIYSVMFVAVGYSLAGGFGFLYLCRPIQKLWDFSVPGSCVDLGAWYLACAALNVATDIVILLLPIWILWPLRVRLTQRLAVMAVLMAGGFVCAVSVIRLVTILGGMTSMDATWVYTPNLVWCIVEMYTGIICACLPALKPFMKYLFPSLFTQQFPEHEDINLSRAIASSGAGLSSWTSLGSTNRAGRFGRLVSLISLARPSPRNASVREGSQKSTPSAVIAPVPLPVQATAQDKPSGIDNV